MAFELPDLPYAPDALEPHMSAKTFSFHHGKHHATYVNKLNAAIEGGTLADKSLQDIIMETAGDEAKKGVFNNAAQTWNHTFFWNSMSPNGGGAPTGDVGSLIDRDFGGYESFKEQFVTTAANAFGSAWTWLVEKDGKLSIVPTFNAGTPMTDGYNAILTCDVWEHAYYLDFQNDRPGFVTTFLENLANWDFANAKLNG